MTVLPNTLAKFTSWKDWFNSRSSATIINKSNQERLFEIFNSNISIEKCRQELEEHSETVFLFRHNFGSNRIDLFHNMTSLGGNLYTTTKDFGFIQGVGEDSSHFMTPDYDTLTLVPQEAAEPIPTASHLLNVSTIDEVTALVVGQTTSYRPRNFVPVPPFLLDTLHTIIEDRNGDTTQALISCAQAIKEFDTLHSIDDDYTDKAKSKSKDILAWLYLVINDKVTATPTMSCQSKILKSRFSNLKDLKLGPLAPPETALLPQQNFEQILQRPLEILATSSSSTQDFLQKLTQIHSQSNDKTARSFKKIAPKYKRMLLVASSQGEALPSEPNTEALDFFSQANVLNAQIYINSMFDSMQIECAISPTLTTSLMHGSFLLASTLTPSGLAASVISSLDVIRSNTLQEGIILDYSTRHEMSSKSLEKLTRTQVLYPATIEASIERLRALHALVQLFFGKLSFPEQGLKKLVNLCSDHKRLLRTKQYLDDMFIPRLLFMVDDRLNQWLEQCCRADLVSDTNLELTHFSSIFSDIQLNKFFCNLPSNILRLQKDLSTTSDTDIDRKKKRLKSNGSQPEQIRNSNQVPCWKIRQSEKWDTIFKNKSRDGPALSLHCKPCLKYQVKGLCYSDCPFKASHVSLNNDDKSKTDRFIKELRGE